MYIFSYILVKVATDPNYDWSMEVEHYGRFVSDFGHVSEEEDTDLENEVTKKIMNSAGNPRRHVASQTDAIGKDALRNQRWRRFMQNRNNPKGWDPIRFAIVDPAIVDTEDVS